MMPAGVRPDVHERFRRVVEREERAHAEHLESLRRRPTKTIPPARLALKRKAAGGR
jgi:hypothetical protein